MTLKLVFGGEKSDVFLELTDGLDVNGFSLTVEDRGRDKKISFISF